MNKKSPLCPECESKNVYFSKKYNLFICEDCLNQFIIEGEESSLRLFLSYGHDSNTDLIFLIKKDLEDRGHEVWIDKDNIKAGDNWRRKITEGIVNSNTVMSFLSKHSVKNPGVCLDELKIAIGVKGINIVTVLIENEKDVQVPSSISDIQWLDMQEWKEKRSAGKEIWDSWYGPKFKQLYSAIERKNSYVYQGEI
mgnify:FL=1